MRHPVAAPTSQARAHSGPSCTTPLDSRVPGQNSPAPQLPWSVESESISTPLIEPADRSRACASFGSVQRVSSRMDIFTGFEGQLDATPEEISWAVRHSPIILDTNVLLDLYAYEQPARDQALELLSSCIGRIWEPHQVLREFWRNRHSAIAQVKDPEIRLTETREGLLSLVNSLTPDRGTNADIAKSKAEIVEHFDALEKLILEQRGEPLPKEKLLSSVRDDPVVTALATILKDRVGAALSADEELVLIEEGNRRFKLRIPPGFEDGSDKREVPPEFGTGDFLLWEQVLRFLPEEPDADSFVFVTNEKKKDWRIAAGGKVLGVRPELATEAYQRTGKRLILLNQPQFYRQLRALDPLPQDADDQLLVATELRLEASGEDAIETRLAARISRWLTEEAPVHGSRIRRAILVEMDARKYEALTEGRNLSRALANLGVKFDTDDSGNFYPASTGADSPPTLASDEALQALRDKLTGHTSPGEN